MNTSVITTADSRKQPVDLLAFHRATWAKLRAEIGLPSSGVSEHSAVETEDDASSFVELDSQVSSASSDFVAATAAAPRVRTLLTEVDYAALMREDSNQIEEDEAANFADACMADFEIDPKQLGRNKFDLRATHSHPGAQARAPHHHSGQRARHPSCSRTDGCVGNGKFCMSCRPTLSARLNRQHYDAEDAREATLYKRWRYYRRYGLG